jgi:hypothetical protein
LPLVLCRIKISFLWAQLSLKKESPPDATGAFAPLRFFFSSPLFLKRKAQCKLNNSSTQTKSFEKTRL